MGGHCPQSCPWVATRPRRRWSSKSGDERRSAPSTLHLRHFRPDAPPGCFEEPSLVVALWQSRRRGEALPRWRDFDIGDFVGWHRNIALSEISSPDADPRFRIFGSGVAELMGGDLTGRKLRRSIQGTSRVRSGGESALRRTDQRSWTEREAPVSPLGQEFLDFWHRKCPAPSDRRRYPQRREISPAEMVPLLPYIFMVDVLDEDGGQDFRFRLVGTAIMDIEGEHTGKRLSAMFPDREAYAVLWRQYHDAAAGKVWVRHETLRWQGRDHVNYEVVLAPLEDDAGRVAILIGLAHAQGEA